jgi:hypothetical protein
MHKLADRDKEQRLHIATWAIHQDGILHYTWFAREVHFHLELSTSKMFDSGQQNVHTSQTRDNYDDKITVWVATSSHGIIGHDQLCPLAGQVA